MRVVDGLAIVELVLVVVVLAALVPVLALVVRRRWLSQQGWVFVLPPPPRIDSELHLDARGRSI